MKRVSIYGIMSVMGIVIRQFVLPNPFECFGNNAALFNWIAESIIQMIAYGVVGLFYVKGSAPALGSIAYCIVYAAIVGLLRLCGLFSFAWWWIAILAVALAALIAGIVWLGSRLGFRRSDY